MLDPTQERNVTQSTATCVENKEYTILGSVSESVLFTITLVAPGLVK
jgi:hypothetical protein